MKRTNELFNRDAESLSNIQKIRFYPLDTARGEGAWLWDQNDKKYLDFSSGWGVANTGYSHPSIIEAVSNQMKRLSFASTVSMINEESVALAEMLIALAPGEIPKSVWYGHSGSEANDFISKIIPLATGKNKILTFVGSYHGQTLGAYGMSGHPAQSQFSGSGDVVKVPYPDCYRCPFEREENECGLFCLRFIENYIFKAVARPEQIGAVEIEAIQCDGGDIVPPEGFLKGLERLCKEHDILLVLDEVKIGLGRTGKMFGFENWNIEPDLIIMAKPLGGGLPLSAVIGPKKIMDIGACLHLFTTAGNPVACAAALANLDIIKNEKLTDNAGRMGEYLLKEFNKLKSKHSCIGDVRGLGLVIGIDLVKDKTTLEPDAELTALVTFRAYELGLLFYDSGLYSNVLELTPPLIISKEQADEAVKIIDQALDDAANGRVAKEKLAEFSGWSS